MKILNGIKLASEILERFSKEIKNRHLKLGLAVILVGDNPISKIYIRQKEKVCLKTGILFRLFKFPVKVSWQKLKAGIQDIVQDPDNSGIIIQLPLPQNFNTQEVLNLIPPGKDTDVLSEISLGKFYTGNLPILPPTVASVSYLLKKYKIKVRGKNVAVIGAGRLVGYPLAVWLLRQKATVSTINEFTKDASSFTKKADILISGVGKPDLIRGNMVKNGVAIIDAGTSIKNGRLVGDVDFKSVAKKASYITPVPGGVGPMTVACLLENLVKLSKTPKESHWFPTGQEK